MTSKSNEQITVAEERAPNGSAAPFSQPSGEALRAFLHLANMQFSSRLTTALLAHFKYDPQAIFTASDSDLDEVPGLQARHLVRMRDKTLAVTERQWSWFERHGVHLVLREDEAYPADLRDIPDPPPMLFVRGNLTEADTMSVGIVGSRHATPYGRSVSERMARELAGQGITIISGGAVGIDAAAHRGALASGGRTIAVLGCGLDVDYPRENRDIFAQILQQQQGALISEYPLGAQPDSWRFPLRKNSILCTKHEGGSMIPA
jgi:DNA processing protein